MASSIYVDVGNNVVEPEEGSALKAVQAVVVMLVAAIVIDKTIVKMPKARTR